MFDWNQSFQFNFILLINLNKVTKINKDRKIHIVDVIQRLYVR